MNSYIEAKAVLSALQSDRASVLIKIKDKQDELDTLKADLITSNAEDIENIAKYNAYKHLISALEDLAIEYAKVRIPEAEQKVIEERVVAERDVGNYLGEKRIIAIEVIEEKLNEVINLMDLYQDGVDEYSKENGNPPVARKLRRIDIEDMPKAMRKRLL